MYNAEKYVGECLDSILAQTFDDYEVIVVDDCSKDNSAAVVESYIPKFNGKLQLVRSEVNSGGAATPRNIALKLARGEYLMFIDSDDAITKTATKELISIAQDNDADILYCERFYVSPENHLFFDKNNIDGLSNPNSDFVTKITPITEDFREKIINFSKKSFHGYSWLYFIRRKLIVKNNLYFPKMVFAEDLVFAFLVICFARKIFRIPNITYTYRKRKDSTTGNWSSIEKHVKLWVNTALQSVALLDKFMANFEIFQIQQQLKYITFGRFFEFVGTALGIYSKVPAFQLDALLRRELEQIGNSTALTAFLFSRMNIFNVNLIQQQNLIRQQQAQIQQLKSQIQSMQQAQPTFQLNSEDIFKI